MQIFSIIYRFILKHLLNKYTALILLALTIIAILAACAITTPNRFQSPAQVLRAIAYKG